ncbi:inositol-polyphosphate multikinase, partial [Schistosoma bovis]
MIVNQKWDSTNDETNKLNYLFESSSLLPSDLINYPNQIGGHGLLFGNKCKILYSHVQSTIYKPIQHYPKGPHELEFYQRLFDPNCNDSVLVELRKFIDLYLGLKDLLANFKHPSLCDLKMGRRTYAPDSSPSKIMIECAKYKWREEIGFLVTGLKVFYPDLNEYTTFDIFFGRSLNPSTIYDNAKWFENQNCYHFYASSLLLAYDSVDANDEIMPSPNTTTT